MKIVLPVHHFPPHYTSGAELYTFRLARWLLAQGHQVDVVCVERTDSGGVGDIGVEFDMYEQVPVWRMSLNLHHDDVPFQWSYNHPTIGRWFTEFLAQREPDLVHLQSGYLLTASVLEAAHTRQIPSIVTLHDYWFLCPRVTLLRGDGEVCTTIPADAAACAWCMLLDSRRFRLPDRVTGGLLGRAASIWHLQPARAAMEERRTFLHQALRWAERVIAPSRFLADMFGQVVEPSRLDVVRLGTDTSRFRDIPSPTNDGTLQLGYIGQIAPHKGIHLLIRAIKMLPSRGRPIQLSIYGDTCHNKTYSQHLHKLIGDDPCIQLAGRFDNSRIAEVLRPIDVIVVPSIWFENSPLAILEAQTARRPVIASAMGGMAELVRHEIDGLHFRPGDAADLARQIQRLRDEPELLPQLHQHAPAISSVEDEMVALFQIYQQVVNQTSAHLHEAA
ncbi:MAG: glycosyltransferase family 4 protein [Chloroflexaceae bacterium]|jgi:glycosyltransferase involved in cell wall biosynthesis|nr:glycosyltransferase family 4 protein [Chloroflexaceae bacterium]